MAFLASKSEFLILVLAFGVRGARVHIVTARSGPAFGIGGSGGGVLGNFVVDSNVKNIGLVGVNAFARFLSLWLFVSK